MARRVLAPRFGALPRFAGITGPSERTGRVLLLATTAVVLSIALGAVTAIVPSALVLLLGCMLVIAFMLAPLPWSMAAAVFLTTALYRGVFFEARIAIFGVPVSAYDVLWMLVLLRVAPVALRGPADRLRLPMILLGASTLLTVAAGLYFDQQTYDIIKFLRTEVFLIIGYLAARAVAAHARLLIVRMLVVGGAFTAVQQVATFGLAARGTNLWARLNIDAYGNRSAYFDVDVTNSAIFRDLGITIDFALIAALILIASIATNRRIFSPFLTATLLMTCLAGAVVSLARNVWVGFVLGLVVLVICGGAVAVRRLRRWTLVLTPLVLLVSALISIAGISSGVTETVLTSRLSTLTSAASDLTVGGRIEETRAALRQLGGWWWLGKGNEPVGFDYQELRRVNANQLHNSYANYLLAGGVLGLGSLLLVLGGALVRTFQTFRRVREGDHRFRDAQFLSLLTLSSLTAISATALVGGFLSDAFRCSVAGLLLGFAVQPLEPLQAPSDDEPPALTSNTSSLEDGLPV